MSHQPVIDGFEFATAGATQEGKLPLAGFPRLKDLLVSDVGEVRYALRGVRDGRGRPSLHLGVDGTLPLRCQRCLGIWRTRCTQSSSWCWRARRKRSMPSLLRWTSPIVCSRGRKCRYAIWSKDELILALPYAPRHEDCEPRHEGIDAQSEREMSSPFAGLRGMMQRKH